MLHDRYRILKPLGQGGFAKTFLALDEQKAPDAFCVIKQFLHQHTSDAQRPSELFQQESQRLADVSKHPQMPQLLNAFEQDGHAFIVQEWIDGWTLEQEVAGAVPFDEVEIWQLLRELLPVLQHLHEHQIIHQDIKPANIIRRRSPHPIASLRQGGRGNLVLVDFGVAKPVEEERHRDAGTLMGSAEYGAPEQILDRAVFASDLYSLGLTCLYLLTQMSPFDLYDMGHATWKWHAYLPQPISPSLKHILCTLLQPATRRRYQSAADVLVAIEAVGRQSQPFMRGIHTLPTCVDSTIAPLATIAPLTKTLASTTSQGTAEANALPLAIAAINAVRMSQSIAAATVYSPQEQRWYDFSPQTDTVTSDSVASDTVASDTVASDSVASDSVASDNVVRLKSHRTDATATTHEWERLPMVGNPVQRRHLLGWHLFTVGVSTAVASVAVTCLWLCVSIIFLAIAVPPHSSATPSQANPSAAPR